MKKGLRILSVLFLVGCMSGCATNNQEKQSNPSSSEGKNYDGRIKTMDFSVIDLTNCVAHSNDPRYISDQDSKPVDAYKRQEKVRMYYLDQIDDVYYITLDSFANIFKSELLDGITSSNTESNGVATWTLSKDNKEIYKLTMDANKKTMSVDSKMEDNYVKPINYGKTGVYDYMNQTVEYVAGHENKTRVFNLAKYDFDMFKVDDKYCFPFALLNAETSKVIERSFVYLSNNQELIEYGNSNQIADTNFLIDGKDVLASVYIQGAFSRQYKSEADSSFNVAPQSLSVFNKKLFYFIMDNYYGIAKEKGIKSMSEYFETFQESDLFLSENGAIRGSAYFKAIQMLNDLHTGYTYSSYFSEFPISGSSSYGQTFSNNRTELQLLLTAMRNDAIKKYNEANGTDLEATDVRYSTDGKYAYFSFDGFNTYNYFGEEESVPENVRLADSFYLFVKNLNEAKAKGAKRVIIDDSVNGGGYVDIMGKLLALMSKDNKSEMFIKDDVNGSIQKMTTRVDSNRDGNFDNADCFGNDFTFYIVTSNYSYSCGNAYPFYANANGLAKIIGQKSGGGECCVFGYTFPTGQGLSYSSPYHLGYYNPENNTFYGDEAGAPPRYAVGGSFYDMYDVDSLQKTIDVMDGVII